MERAKNVKQLRGKQINLSVTIVCLVFQQSLPTLLTRDGKTKKRLDNRTRFKSDAVTDLLVSSRFVTEKVGKDGII